MEGLLAGQGGLHIEDIQLGLQEFEEEEGLSVFRLDYLDSCAIMVNLQKSGKGQGTLSQVTAVCSMFNKVLGNECEVNKFESQVRRSSVKKMNM